MSIVATGTNLTYLSVVIPVYNSAKELEACLRSLSLSLYPNYECIVVDDFSTDASVEVGRRHGATVLSSGGRKGPAFARNIGALAARGEIIYFIDADVCVYPGTLSRVASTFENNPGVSALIGSYDDSPDSPDFLSQYKNLMHCYVHQTAREEATTFWSGCGAIRKSVFMKFDGFDEGRYRRPAIEDIELGYRLHAAGCKIILDRELVVKHLKRWTFWGLVKTDVRDRGIPWTELILRDRHLPNDLNVQLSQRVSVALVFCLILVSLAVAIQWRGYVLIPFFATVLVLLGRYWVDAAMRRSWWAIAALNVSLAAIVGLSYHYHMIGLIPPVLLAYAALFVRHRYARHTDLHARILVLAAATYVVLATAAAAIYLPHSGYLAAAFGLVVAVVVLNSQFYVFLAEKRGRVFAVGAIPFHLLYHFYNGLAFAIGLARHLAGQVSRWHGAAAKPAARRLLNNQAE